MQRKANHPTVTSLRVVQNENGEDLIACDCRQVVIARNSQTGLMRPRVVRASFIAGSVEELGGLELANDIFIGLELDSMVIEEVKVDPYDWTNPTTGETVKRSTSWMLVEKLTRRAVETENSESKLNVDV